MNKVTLAGHLTRDPEARNTPNGTPVSNFGMATNRHWTDGNGERKEEVTFIDVHAYGRTAEIASEHLRKGQYAIIEGRLKMETWEDRQTGEKRSKMVIICEQIHFVPGQREQQGERARQEQRPSPARTPQQPRQAYRGR